MVHVQLSDASHTPLADGERRHVTVMFTDLVGFTPLTDRLGEEGVFSLIRRLANEQSEIIARHGGVLQDFAGDGLMAVFGAPTAIEDAPLRACRTALDIQGRIRALGPELEKQFACTPKLRIGLHAGPVIVGQIGTDKALAYNALGDTVNLAARVQSAAEPDAVYCTKSFADLVSGFAEITELGSRELKGKSAPVALCRVERLRIGMSRFGAKQHRGLSNFKGRQFELDQVREWWSTALSDHSVVAVISGEAGLGKSRIVYEFQRELEGRPIMVLEAACRSEAATTPFHPFIDLLRDALSIPDGTEVSVIESRLVAGLGRLGLEPHPVLPYLLNLLGRDSGGLGALPAAELTGVRTREALIGVIEGWSRLEHPLLLLIEDLHWADSASMELLRELAERTERIRMMLLLTTRSTKNIPWTADARRLVELRLAPLNSEDAAGLVRERLVGHSFSPDVLRTAILKAEGNPLFAEEIANFLANKKDKGSLQTEDVPTSLENLIMDRVHRLQPEERAVVQTASVIGRQFPTELVSDVCQGLVAAADVLPKAGEQDIVFRVDIAETTFDPEYAFKHALIQDALYGSLLKTQRAQLHARTAIAIERRAGVRTKEFADILAHHYCRTTSVSKAVHYLALAAERSLRVFSLGEAMAYLDQALQRVDADPTSAGDKTVADLVVNRLLVCCWEADFGGMIRIAEKHLPRIEKLGPSRELSRSLAWLGEGYLNSERFEEAQRSLRRALQIGESINDLESIAYAKWDLIWLRLLCPDGHSMVAYREDCRELLKFAAKLDDVYLETLTYYTLWAEALQRGIIGQAKEWADKSIQLANRTGYPPARSLGLMMSSFAMAVAGDATTALSEGEAAFAASGGHTEQLGANCAIAIALLSAGRTPEAVSAFETVYQQIESAGFHAMLTAVEVPKWAAVAASGRLKEGLAGLENAIELFSRWGNSRMVAWANLVLGQIYVQIASAPRPALSKLLREPYLLRLGLSAPGRARTHLAEAVRLARLAETPGFLMQALMAGALPPVAKLDKRSPHLLEARKIAVELGAAPLVEQIDRVIS
ncbi:adenylate/guanylate cyclase domain-containing protein [Mesorhizobium sp. M0047]|uniref:ATP-binding protein n=1 Tax=Mesorhizobium sp. M0047 TaxID=2956859 RepID=UPI0033364473